MRALPVLLLGVLLVGCTSPTVTALPTVAPVVSPQATPSPSAPTERLVCGRLSAEACAAVAAAVERDLAVSAQNAVIVADYSCPPRGRCPAVTSGFNAIVAVAFGGPPAGALWPPTYSFFGPGVLTPWSASRPSWFIDLLRSAGVPVQGWDVALSRSDAPARAAGSVAESTVAVPLAGTHAVVVTIEDQSGLLTGARPAALPVRTVLPESYGTRNIAAWNPAGQPTSEVWLYWGGVICDVTSRLIIGPGATSMTVTEAPYPACDAANDGRGLIRTFSAPMDAAVVATTFVVAQPTQ